MVAVGSGKSDEKGNIVKPNLSVGNLVLYSKYAGVEFEVCRQNACICQQEQPRMKAEYGYSVGLPKMSRYLCRDRTMSTTLW